MLRVVICIRHNRYHVVIRQASLYSRPMIEVTERAADKLTALAVREHVPPSVRLGVRGGGCNGYSYIYEFDACRRETDTSWTVLGLTLLCDPKSLKILSGCRLDFEPSVLRGGFRFSNPSAKQTCSCGESFSL